MLPSWEDLRPASGATWTRRAPASAWRGGSVEPDAAWPEAARQLVAYAEAYARLRELNAGLGGTLG